MDREAVKAMTEKLNKYIEQHGIPGIMPAMSQLREGGFDDLANGVTLLGGVLKACKVCRLKALLPKARKGMLNVTFAPVMFGQKKRVIQGLSLNDIFFVS